MSILRAQVALAADSALPRDVCVNTFHFVCPDGAEAASAAAVGAALEDAYKVAPAPHTITLASMMSSLLALTGHRIKVYDLADLQPRVPLVVRDFTLAATGSDSLPGEVALCLSYKASALAGTSASRRRGRVYLGPLATSSVISGTTSRPLGNSNNQIASVALSAFKKMAEALNGAPNNTSWIVYSTMSTDQISPAVTDLWVDDAFDIQRRRGVAPTSRWTATVTP